MWVVLNTWKPQGREFCFRIHVWWNFGQQLGPHQTISDYIMLVVTGLSWPIILYRDDVQRRVRFGFQLEVLQGARSPQSYIQSCIKNQKKPKQTWTHQKKKENMSTHLHIDRISIDMLDYHFFKFFHDGLWQLRKNQAELPCFQVILEALKVIRMHQFEALHGRFGLGTFCICFTLLNGNRL